MQKYLQIYNAKSIPEPLHGKVGIPAVWATIEDAILSPRDHIAFSGGPVTQFIIIYNQIKIRNKSQNNK